MGDVINHPAHYRAGGLECLDVIEAYRLGYHLGNALKYIWRCGRKSERRAEDLQKARFYLKRAASLRDNLVIGLPQDHTRPAPLTIAEALGLSVALTRAVSMILTPMPGFREMHMAVACIGDELASLEAREPVEAT